MTTGPPRAFQLDAFQVRAIEALDAGASVLVAAPTGSGKTVVAEHAIELALAAGRRAFYTAPIKALSNQKFTDLCRRHGAANVGLLTGDNSINGDAPIVVMTTEVLRNMVYAAADLSTLDYVVLDEVHYLQDAYRGPVWEEVIIHLPAHVRLVCLSATVSNAEELTDWISLVRGPTEVVVETERPIRLEHLFMAADRAGERLHLVPTLLDGRPNPEGQRFDATLPGRGGARGAPGRGGRVRHRYATPRRLEVLEELHQRDLLPVLYFVFSRAGCDEATTTCLNGGLRLTTAVERDRIRQIVDERLGGLSPEDLAVLGYDRWFAALEAGIAAHHAGMVPPFKEAVETCFVEGLVKAVFATETLALGINMPARSVVIEKLTKFTGEKHEFLTAGEYTQLCGRAGRRGIDDEGHAVVLWSPFVSFEEVAALASSRSFFLRSAFRPTYNMAANLVARYVEDEAYRLLNRSFAQYQADRSVVRMERQLAQRRADLDRLRANSPVDPDEIDAYVALRRAALDAGTPDQAAKRAVEAGLARLVPGTVIRADGEPGVVLSVAQRRGGTLLKVVGPSKRVQTLRSADFLDPPVRLGAIDLPHPYAPHHRTFQDEVVRRLVRARIVVDRGGRRYRRGNAARNGGRGPLGEPLIDSGPAEAEAAARWEAVEAHPLHDHPDRDALVRAAVRHDRARAEVADLRTRIDNVGDTVARRFRRLLDLLETWGYVDNWGLTERGRILARCYHENDLLVSEALATGLFDGVDAPTLAGLVSCLTYEHRSRQLPPAAWFPSKLARDRWRSLQRLHERLERDEQLARLPTTRPPDATFAAVAHAWASGGELDHVLEDEDLSGGDFVRNMKQLIDLLRQVGELAPSPVTGRVARQAAEALYRGVVSASSGVDMAAGEPGEGALVGGVPTVGDPPADVSPTAPRPRPGDAEPGDDSRR